VQIFFTLIFFFAIESFAKNTANHTVDFTPVQMIVQNDDRVVIKGYKGSVDYIVSPAAKDITVEMKQSTSTTEDKMTDDWQFLFKRDGSEIQIFIDGPASKTAWVKMVSQQNAPAYEIRVRGPALPVTINWNEGRISINDLSSQILVTSLKADISILRGEGDVMVSNQEGAIFIRDRKGAVKIDSYNAKVDIENIEGQLDLDNFMGETRAQNVSGQMKFSSYRGVSRLARLKGRLDFKNGNSALNIEKFEGELRGKSAQGAVNAEIRGDADVRLESAEGTVNLQLPASGAWVNLGSVEGNLVVPSHLKLTRTATQQIRTGRLRGGAAGTIFVRTKSGDIRIK
jgi:DUF4097 and DUF4098 domain-containing protein YvlB